MTRATGNMGARVSLRKLVLLSDIFDFQIFFNLLHTFLFLSGSDKNVLLAHI